MRSGSGFITELLGLRPGELRRVGTMFSLLGLIITASYILKPVRNSLFLSQFGAAKLPYVYITVALVIGFVAALLTRLASRFHIPNVLMGAALFFAMNLVFFYLAIERDWRFTGFIFYIWVSVYAISMPSLFWLAANYVFYSNEAKRVFGILTAGGLLGSILGGGLASGLVAYVGTATLLLLAAIVLFLVAIVVFIGARRDKERTMERRADLRRQQTRRVARSEEGAFARITRSRYLTSITVFTFLITVSSTLVDYQFNAVAEESYRSMDSLTLFFGTFFAVINVAAFLLQLLLAGRLIGRFGVGAGLLVLPLALFTGSWAFMLLPGIGTVTFIKASDDGLSNSLNKSSVEILWLPITLEVKNRVKSWLDLFVERSSRGIGGLLILLSTTVLSVSVPQMSWIVLALVTPWLLLTFSLRNEYIKAFRASIARRDIDIATLTEEVQDQQGMLVLRQVLSGSDEKQILYALGLLEGTEDESLIEPLMRLSSHPNPSVRAVSLRRLSRYPSPPRLENLAALARDPNPEVGAEALGLLLRLDAVGGRRELHRIFETGDPHRVHAVLHGMEGHTELLREIVTPDFVGRYYDSDRDAERELAAHAIAFLPSSPETRAQLVALLQDRRAPVARAAATSAARLGCEELIPHLFQQLSRRPVRVAARRALASFGPKIAAPALASMEDTTRDLEVRRAVPRLLAELEDEKIVHHLLARLPQPDSSLHFQSIRALGKMRARNPQMRFPRKEVERLIRHEALGYCTLAGHHVVLADHRGQDACHRLLARALQERLELARERIFRLLGLIYPAIDLFNAWNRLVHGRAALRAAALELLGSLLSQSHGESVLPLLEASSWFEVHAQGQRLFGLPAPDYDQALIELLDGSDAWLSACAATVVGETGSARLRPRVALLCRHPDAVVRESAELALNRIDSQDSILPS